MKKARKNEDAGNPDSEAATPAEPDFPIADLPDLRRLRHRYLRSGERAVGVDSSGNPRPGDPEEDLGLRRSTVEEARAFLRETLADNPTEPDDLLEFLDDC